MYLGTMQLNYIIKIVENDFSITQAAKEVHITQSALSQFINNYEKNENIKLFIRGKNSRIEGLTTYGQVLYIHAKDIVAKYDEMNNALDRTKLTQKEKLRFGLTSTYIRIYFPDLLPRFSINYPNIEIDIVDDSLLGVENRFKLGELDFGLMTGEAVIDSDKAEMILVEQSELVAYLAKTHPLASKDKLNWKDLEDYPLISFSKNFFTYQQLSKQIQKLKLKANIISTSPSWDYLMESAHHTNGITISPSAPDDFISNPNIVVKRFHNPVMFDLYLARLKDTKSPESSEIFKQHVMDYIPEQSKINLIGI